LAPGSDIAAVWFIDWCRSKGVHNRLRLLLI